MACFMERETFKATLRYIREFMHSDYSNLTPRNRRELELARIEFELAASEFAYQLARLEEDISYPPVVKSKRYPTRR